MRERLNSGGQQQARSAAWEHVHAGDRLLAEGNEQAAEAEYRRATTRDPSLAQAHRRLALALYKRGELEEAREAAKKATTLRPESVEAWFALGLILRDARDSTAALAAFDEVIELQPEHVEALHSRGRVLYEVGARHEAVRSFERAAELAPGSADIAHDLAIAQVACESWGEAERWFARCIELEPDHAETYYELGQAHERDVTTPDTEAEQNYLKAVELNPEHLPAHFRLALLWARRRRTDGEARARAVDTLTRLAAREDLIHLFPDAHLVHYLLGAVLDDEPATAGRAAEAYRTCLQLDPGFAPAHNNLGILALGREDFEAAAEHFTRAIISDPDFDSAFHNLCRILYDQPNELTVRQVRDIVDIVPDEAPDITARLVGHLVETAKADAYASSYDKVHEIKNLIGVLGARMRKALTGQTAPRPADADELMELHGRAFDAIRGYLGAIETAPAQSEVLDCGDILEATLRQLAVTRPTGVEVECAIEPALPALNGDRRRLTQLFRNLIVNAFEAMPDVGVLAVTAQPLEPSGTALGAAVRRGVRIVLRDSGPGITEEQLRRAFDPGYTTKESGSGYGLAVVSQVVREHGGTVALERGESGGTCVIVELPQRPQPEAASEPLRLRPVIHEDWRRLIQAELDAIQPGDGSAVRDSKPGDSERDASE
jgi:signal transduction histidine kinase